jgi:1-phosphofructokinase
MADTTRVVVFAPAPILTVTIEVGPDEDGPPNIHVHAGGQGFWVARMAAALDGDPVLCTAPGSETGQVAKILMEDAGIEVRGPHQPTPTGAYVHDRRSGDRVEIASAPGSPLSRHDLDELYTTTLAAALEQGLCVLTGPMAPNEVPAEVYERLAGDLRSNGVQVLADLSGECLQAALAGGIDLLKVSHEELLDDGLAEDDDVDSLWAAAEEQRKRGAKQVVVTRADQPTLALLDDGGYVFEGPVIDPADPRGAGDSLTAGVAAALAHGADPVEAVGIGVAAGVLNAGRRGLATGTRDEILRLADHVAVTDR